MSRFRTRFTAVAGALTFAAFLQPAIAAGGNRAAAAKIDSYLEANGLVCTGCHAFDYTVVGPSWISVAKKYKGKAGAVAEVAKRIAGGSSGIWGSLPMPPGQTTPAQAKKLAEMILGLDTK
ncbi:cytochrome c-551 precursor [bacterium BMS3Bbin12]|nr:cytochrome c-551 precursor [bacterium BMS3Abin12]GBE46896.1 cytochrome c-551 precursor [bacterium BMS3Bbin12]GBE50903.1 cytochrome c-551 precursor [bacterium BMS3Bbin13]HDK02433.1 hypothetical protein [Gammaproteobacteria bacterium]HDO33987.1 hypothetical protein [Chromatiales bacterium]